MKQIISYLNFDGNTREVMSFYQRCLGGELTLQTIGEAPFADQLPQETHHRILHSSLEAGGISIMASDMVMGGLTTGNNVSLMLSCNSEEETHTLFDRLAAGGAVRDPLGVKFWGDLFGALTDKYGINWLLIFEKGREQ